MGIQYLKHKEIDKSKWNYTIEKSFNGIVFAYSWYLDIVSPEWDALVSNDYKTVMPLTKRKKFGLHYIYQPFFSAQGGIFSVEKISSETVNNFLEAIPRKFKLLEFCLNTFNKPSSGGSFNLTEIQTFELDLINSYEAIVKDYSQNTKRNIKKAIKHKVYVTKGVKPEPIIELFKNNRGKQITTYQQKDYQTLKRLMYKLLHKNKAEIWGAYDEHNTLCAGAFFVGSNNKAIFLFSGSNEEAKKNGAMPYLIDQFIKENSLQNMTLDFNGSNNENMARFYKGFGSKRCTYSFVKKNNLPWYIKAIKK